MIKVSVLNAKGNKATVLDFGGQTAICEDNIMLVLHNPRTEAIRCYVILGISHHDFLLEPTEVKQLPLSASPDNGEELSILARSVLTNETFRDSFVLSPQTGHLYLGS
jgi:hypothetical protein